MRARACSIGVMVMLALAAPARAQDWLVSPPPGIPLHVPVTPPPQTVPSAPPPVTVIPQPAPVVVPHRPRAVDWQRVFLRVPITWLFGF